MTSPLELAPRVISSFRDADPDRDGHPARGEAWRPRREPEPLGPPVHVPASAGDGADLLGVLRRRRSIRFYDTGALPAAGITAVVRRGIEADVASWPDEQEHCPLETFAIAFRLDGLDPGMYAVDPAGERYTPVAPLPPAHELDALTLQSEFCRSAVIISVAGDPDAAIGRHGAHGYRMLMTRAAAAAYTMWLCGVGRDWVGSVFAGFIPAAVRIPLCSDGSSRHQLFALALGALPAPAPSAPAEAPAGAGATQPPTTPRKEEIHA